ncbi:Glycosyltransferase, catalytic subunit of cellulose synthase and poly-beta-1,6-N-acetylglucosamine synthase [Microbulbifer marinus]|uniref:Glycosyltransferase, catalytic subunit of cellulose synthase and poly-beta-1,6-N-acetylglucosamine synthase n=2 Tax=Microbulbifer marinus TaxID=658218 RepID=A0A1H3YSG7_9GAMM|nr:Glycosyltransferase, catalytic subunit of cellulose synthase and poly-beta-1,6-N-acetylglucosamine synthase [Microbulbifer marinus]
MASYKRCFMDELFLLLLLPGAILLLWILVLLSEVICASKELNDRSDRSGRRTPPSSSSYVVIIPAHDESRNITGTIGSLKPLMTDGGRILVVADNCSDNTACLARQCGVDVIERHDSERRGKGYALGFALQQLQPSPPDVIVVLDADCEFSSGCPADLVNEAAVSETPIQCHYAMHLRGSESLSERIAHFAWRLKNYLRPLGLRFLNLPCQLAGSGMAFRWDQLRSVNVASANLVEDLELGINLAVAGAYPRYFPDVIVKSKFPMSATGMQTQRERWEHGHILVILTQVPLIALASFKRRDLRLFVLAMDISVPPVSLLLLLTLVNAVLSLAIFTLGWATLPLALSLLSCVLLTIAISGAWALSARDLIRPIEFLRAATHPVKKIDIYTRFLTRRQRQWIRTDRK